MPRAVDGTNVAPMRMGVWGLWLLCAAGLALSARGADWPQWGGSDTRNMVSGETGLPDSFNPGIASSSGAKSARKSGKNANKHSDTNNNNGVGTGDVTTSGAINIKWVARLGNQTYGSPVIAGGKVLIGTNNESPRDPRFTTDRSVLMCFDEATGKFLWQLTASKLKPQSNFNGDDPRLGICSTPTVKDGRVYLTTTRCEAICLDANGLANGNDGPFKDEGEYIAAPARLKVGKQPTGGYPADAPTADARGPFAPMGLRPTDADIIWRYDFIAEHDVWPQDATDCSPLVWGDLVYVCTSNGVDRSHKDIPTPEAPTLLALYKKTGKLAAVDDAKIGPRIFHGSWSSPSPANVKGKALILFGGADGFCYAFDPKPAAAPDGKGKILKTVWRCDCNPPEYRTRNGQELPYNKNSEGPSELMCTPVFHDNRVYVTIGQDTRHGPGPGALTCIDATQRGDISKTGVVWRYTGISRSFSTPSIVNGLLFAADVTGAIHCLDAETGRLNWKHETNGQMVGSTLVADGKVYTGNAAGKLTILAAGKEKKLINEILMDSTIHATPTAANGVLYIATQNYLYAIQKPGK